MTFHTTVLFANVCFPAFFGLDGVVSFLSLRLYTALVASWLHRFVGVGCWAMRVFHTICEP